MIVFFKKIHRYIYILNVVFFFCLLYPFLYYYSRKTERFKVLNKFRRLWGFLSSFFAGIFYRYHTPYKIDWSRNYIICANHSSNLDITVLSLLIKSNFAFMGKEELLQNPFTGLFFKTVDIPLNRDRKISAFKAFKRAGEYLNAGMSLAIFPEGKIPDEYPPVLGDFKNGPFRLAVEYKIPIIPVTISDSWKKMWDDGSKYGSRPGICDICVHALIDTSGLSLDDMDSLREKVYEIINSEIPKK